MRRVAASVAAPQGAAIGRHRRDIAAYLDQPLDEAAIALAAVSQRWDDLDVGVDGEVACPVDTTLIGARRRRGADG